ncbi:MAG: ABC transporter substrate-binding protein [Halodesulfovibrio sp.]
MKNTFRVLQFVLAVVLAGLIVLWHYSTDNGSPIIIGLSGPLEGKFADLGIQVRNGVQLCIEHINAKGGIQGHPLELVTRHDGDTPEQAVAADEALMGAGAVAIIGHMTSQQSVAALKALHNKGIVYVSPSTSTPDLTGIKDNFFRVMTHNTAWAQTLADYATRTQHLTRIAVIYDTDNESYTRSFSLAFADRIREQSATVTIFAPISSSRKPDWKGLINEIKDTQTDGVFVALAARDVSSFAQNMYVQGLHLPLFCTPWALTNDLIMTGGRHMEHLTASFSYNPSNDRPEYLAFKKQYEKRFGITPTYASFGYEAMQLLAAALEKTGGKKQGLPEALVSLDELPGINSPIKLDQFGDRTSAPLLLKIQNGTMVLVQ